MSRYVLLRGFGSTEFEIVGMELAKVRVRRSELDVLLVCHCAGGG